MRTILTLGLAALSLGALAQTPPKPPMDGPRIGQEPGPRGPMGHGGPGSLMDPRIQKELGLSKAQIAKIRALAPKPPKPGEKPPLPPKPGSRPPEEARMEAVLTKAQRVKFKAIRRRHEHEAPPRGPKGGPLPPRP